MIEASASTSGFFSEAREMNAGDPLFRKALNSVCVPSHSFV